ncbi:MAG: hypothetical protein GXY36_01930 [Chloroflexi bacterium]|jgi:hypothetical protein|nr:hypothetical protein [Chloroflexota bacterium]
MPDDIYAALSREELLRLLDMYAKNWLAHDGSWFLTIEEAYGTETAVEMDVRAWERFAVSEARRILREFDLPPDGGLTALEKALQLRMYARINRQEIEWAGPDRLIFRMVECRVQITRQRKGLPPFACRPVGVMEFTKFAETIDPRIQTRCLGCPPDPVTGAFCGWEFTLKEETSQP